MGAMVDGATEAAMGVVVRAMVDGATEAAMGAGVGAMVDVMPTSGNGGTWWKKRRIP